MKKILSMGLALAAVVAIAAWSPVQAACTTDVQVLFHGLGSWFDNCKDNQPVAGYAYTIAGPTVALSNSAGHDIVCEDASNLTPWGTACQPEAGIAGDKRITVLYGWGSGEDTTSVGCPNPAGAGTGTTTIAIIVVDNDGKGLLLTNGFNESVGGFQVEDSQPFDPSVPSFSGRSRSTSSRPMPSSLRISAEWVLTRT